MAGFKKVIGETAKRLVVEHGASVEIRSGDVTSTASLIWNGVPVKTYQTEAVARLYISYDVARDQKGFKEV